MTLPGKGIKAFNIIIPTLVFILIILTFQTLQTHGIILIWPVECIFALAGGVGARWVVDKVR